MDTIQSHPKKRTAEWVVIAVSLICFVNVLPNDFCYDDVLIVRDHDKVNAPDQWLNIWTSDHWSDTQSASPNRDLLYRPVSLCSYRLTRVFFGQHPWPHHLINLLLHAMISVMVMRLCRKIGGSQRSCWIAGLCFAVLPMHTEVVASVVGRADLLATIFILSALFCHCKSLSCADRYKLVYWRTVSAITVFLSLGSKESGIAAIPLMVLFDWFLTQKIYANPKFVRWVSIQTFLRLIYVFVPTVAYFLLRFYALGGHLYQQPPMTKTVNVLVDTPSWQHALGVLQLWGMYWAKTIWPAVLNIKYTIHGIHLATDIFNVDVLLGLLVIVGLVGMSYAARKQRNHGIAFLSVALVFSYLPTANIFPLMQVFFAERIWYLPSVFLVILVGLQLESLIRNRSIIFIGLMLMVAMMGRCWLRNSEWKNNGSLFAAACRQAPDSVGPLQLYGSWLTEQGQQDEGIELLNHAVLIDPGYTDAHRNLGHVYLSLDNVEAAVRHLQIAAMQVSDHPTTNEALAIARDRFMLQSKEDTESFQLQADANPDDLESQLILIRHLREHGLIEVALDQLQKKEPLFARSAIWQREYAVTCVYFNEIDHAIERYEKSLAIQPDHVQTMIELAMILLERKLDDDLDHAMSLARGALSNAPKNPQALVCMAEMYVHQGNSREAVQYYRHAITLLPVESQQRRMYEQRLKALGY